MLSIRRFDTVVKFWCCLPRGSSLFVYLSILSCSQRLSLFADSILCFSKFEATYLRGLWLQVRVCYQVLALYSLIGSITNAIPYNRLLFVAWVWGIMAPLWLNFKLAIINGEALFFLIRNGIDPSLMVWMHKKGYEIWSKVASKAVWMIARQNFYSYKRIWSSKSRAS